MTHRLILPFEKWPHSDRQMWDTLMADGGPLDDRGAMSHLRDTSRTTLREHYGRWLFWLVSERPDASNAP